MGFITNLFNSRNTMKTFVAIALTCMVSVISASISCDECLDFAGKVANMAEEKNVADQVNLLVAVLCPMTIDPIACDDGLRTYWPAMADIIYSTYLEKNAVCGQLGLCGFKGLRSEATCGDCTDGVNGAASLLVGREKVFEMIELLQGEICQGNENCNYSVKETMPFAMPVISGILMLRAPTFCCNFSNGGLCC